jgi:heme exporter protein D
MSYRDYVIGAYAIFAIVLLWDFFIPKLQTRAALRAAKLRNARKPVSPTRNPELPLSRD